MFPKKAIILSTVGTQWTVPGETLLKTTDLNKIVNLNTYSWKSFCNNVPFFELYRLSPTYKAKYCAHFTQSTVHTTHFTRITKQVPTSIYYLCIYYYESTIYTCILYVRYRYVALVFMFSKGYFFRTLKLKIHQERPSWNSQFDQTIIIWYLKIV